jgi:hypothetical protein
VYLGNGFPNTQIYTLKLKDQFFYFNPPNCTKSSRGNCEQSKGGDYGDFPGKKAGSHDYEFLRRSLNALLYKINKRKPSF